MPHPTRSTITNHPVRYAMWPTHKNSLLSGYAVGLKLLNSLSMLPIVGTKAGSFGLAAALAPLMGFFAGSYANAFVYGARTALSFSTTLALGSFLVHIPTLAGTLVLSSGSRALTRIVSLLCIATFIAHPIGRESFIYSLYWLIPLGISFVPAPSIFIRSLSSTFITHAVGSTIFIYTHATTSIFWQALIPQVWLERLAYALILTASYFAVTVSISLINQRRFESSPCLNR